MRNKLILFLMLALFGSTSFLRADEVTIGSLEGAGNNSYLPMNSLYNYSYTQQIYTADEIGMAGTINGFTMWLYGNANLYTMPFDIYVVEVDKDVFTSTTDWVPVTEADKVYSGTVTVHNTEAEPYQFVFDTPFTYSGENNLLIAFNNTTGQWKSGLNGKVFGVDSDPVRAIYVRQDGAAYNPFDPTFTASSITYQRNVVMLDITPGSGPTPPTPPTPTGELTITPNPLELAFRPNNGWMEPYAVRIENGGAETSIEGSMSNTSGDTPFTLNPAVNATLATGDVFEFVIETNNTIAGEYTEEFTLFYTGGDERDIVTIPVTATIYQAGEADIVETAPVIPLTYDADGIADFTVTPVGVHPNYNLIGMAEMANDAVYQLNIAQDSKIAVIANGYIAIFNKVLGFHPSTAVAPVLFDEDGVMVNETILAGQYYLIVAGNDLEDIEGTIEQIPAPTELTALAPADGATEVESPVTLTWEGGENATQYRVLFGTSPVNMPAVLDWTMVDENFGSFTIAGLSANTQYFWQIEAKNSNGLVSTARRGFTTTLTAPNTVTASETQIFTDGSTLIKWKHSSGTIGDLPETQIGSGTNTSPYLPTYNLYNYSLTEQIYTGEEIGEAGFINSISFHPVGDITRNLKIYMANTDKTSFTSGSDWVAMSADDLVYEGVVAMVANSWVTIELNEPFEFDGSNLLIAVTDHTGTWTSSIQYSVFDATAQAINVYQDTAPYNALAPSGSGTVRAFKNQIIINKASAKGFAQTRSFLGYNVYYGDVKANDELLTEKQYLLENLPYNMEGHDINVTAVYDEGESGHSTPIVTVQVSGYATMTGQVTELISGAPVAGATVRFFGKDEFQNDVNFEGTTNNNGIYNITVKAGTYNRGVASLDDMEPAVEIGPFEVAYEGTETVDFVMHEVYVPVFKVYAQELDPTTAKVIWSLNDFVNPTPGGNTPGGGGSGSSFTEGFEGGMPAGWNVIDGNNDGYTWCLTSAIPSTWTYYASITLDWYRTGTNAICSGSYINGVGALTPNEYLVTPQVTIGNGSTFSFWAAATDASYAADHFGVFVSDNGTSDWTMVNEWTLTGKANGNGGRASRNGNGAKLGTWYQYTVDLSAHAGQKYIAIRHFNCNDQYIMCVDDVALTSGSKNRLVDNYTVVRKAILKENDITEADSVTLVEQYTDTVYADVHWNDMEPGLYQYGVSAVYPSPVVGGKGNRESELTVHDGTSTNGYVPVYGFYADAYLKCEMVYPADELSQMAGGTISQMKFYASQASVAWGAANFQVFMKEVADPSISAFAGSDDATMVYEGPLNITANEMLVEFTTPYNYNGGNLLVGFYNTVTGSYVTSTWSGEAVTGASVQGYSYTSLAAVSPTQRNFLPKTTFTYEEGGSGGGNDNPETPITWSNILPKNMDAQVKVEVVAPAGTVESARIEFVNQFEGEPNFSAVVDSAATSVEWDNFRKGNYNLTVTLEGYESDYNDTPIGIWEDEQTITVHLTEILAPVDALNVSGTGYARWTPVVPQNRVAEKYFVTLNGALYTETTDNSLQFDHEDLEIGTTYTAGVAVVYSTGMSPYVTKSFTFNGCDQENPEIDTIYHDEDMNVTLVWNGGTPTPTPPTPPTPPTGNTYDFNDGTFQGWTTIDGNNDGYNWVLGSQVGGVYLVTGASLAGSGHNSSADLVCSGSYSNATSSAITPNNFLVSPAKAEYTGISFWACGQDASYVAEHFGVAVSTAGNTSASDFTIVQEWTMTAKDQGAMSIGRDGQVRAQGSWHEYTVDLSAYAGQEIWVAIRHFNCNDMFILDVDDITLGVPEKCASAETCGYTTASTPSRDMWDLLMDFNGTSGYQYGVATDGTNIYTSSWSSSSTSMFYKYDMEGNFIEEFNVSGCGQIRDLTYDGQYFYGVANSSTIYCIDLANHALVGQTSSAYGAMRCCSYDSERDGFWVVGNWSGNLTLVDRTGAIVFTGPAPTSASGVAYYKDNDGVEHVLCFNNGDNGVYDYNITTNVMGGQVFNYNSAPGTGSGSAGGCHIANFGDKLAFYGDIQASPQYIAIYELGEAQGGGTVSGATTYTPNKFNILVDGVVVGYTADNTYTWNCPDYDEHLYEVVWVDSDYNISCPEGVLYRILPLEISTFDVAANIYPNPTNGDIRIEASNMVRISVVNTLGQVVYDRAVEGNEAVINMAQFGNGVYMVNIATESGNSVKRVVVSK